MVIISRGTYCPLLGIKGSTGLLINTCGLRGEAEQETVRINQNHVKVK